MPNKIVPPENCDFAERNFCAMRNFLVALSRNCAIFAMERNFCANLAPFVLFLAQIDTLHFGEILGLIGTFEHP